MSQENVEMVGAALDVFLAGTRESDREGMLKAIAETWDPVIELDASEFRLPDLNVGGTYSGKDAVLQFFRGWLDAWETLRYEYELVDAGERVVVLLDQRLRGRSTGIEVPLVNAMIVTVKGGLTVHLKLLMSHSEALEAAGLRE